MAKIPKAIADMSTLTRVIFDLDTTPPSLPSNVAGVAISSTRIDLTWTASVDTGGSGMAGYLVFRNGVQIGSPSVPSYSDTGLTASTSYQYQIEAVDGAGNASSKTTAIAVSTQANVGVPAYVQNQPKAALIGIAGVRTYTDPTQQAAIGRYNWTTLGASWEGWASSGRDLETIVKAIKAASTAPGGSLIFNYERLNGVEEDANDPHPTYTAEVAARNWRLFVTGSSGTLVTPNDGSSTALVNYTDFVPVNPSLEHPLEYGAAYSYNKFLTKSKSDGRFTGLAAGLASPSLDGIYQDNFLCNPQVNGDWNRDGVTEGQGWPGTATPWLQAGQKRYVDRIRSLAPTKYVVINGGDYGVVTDAGPMAGQADSILCESYIGKYYSWETQKGFVTMLTYYYRALTAAANPQLVVFGVAYPDTAADGSALPRLPTANGYPPQLTQDQWFTYGAAIAYLGEGMPGLNNVSTGYSSDLAALFFPWFYGGVTGLPRSWFGPPLNAWRPTTPKIAKGTIGLYGVEYTNAMVLVNPVGNGTQNVTNADIPGNWQFPTGSTQGTGVFSSISLPERSGLFLQRYTPASSFAPINSFLADTFAQGAAPNVGNATGGSDGQLYTRYGSASGQKYGLVVANATSPTFNAQTTNFIRPGHTKSFQVSIQANTSGFPSDGETPAANGMFGCLMEAPLYSTIGFGQKGQWVHWGAWFYVQSTTQLRTTSLEAGALKFCRSAYLTTTASKDDWHICEQPNGFASLNEYDPNNTANNNYPDQRSFGGSNTNQTGFPRDQWFFFEFGVFLTDNGDQAIRRGWIGDVMQLERNGRVIKWRTNDGTYHTNTLGQTGMPSLPTAAAVLQKFFIFTYWNAHPAKDTVIWMDGIVTANESRTSFNLVDNLGQPIIGSGNSP